MIARFIQKDTFNLLFEGLAGVCTQLRRERESLILCGEKNHDASRKEFDVLS